ncbi:PAS domain-containing protein [Ferrovibrio sp. MS7]|uniref:PAS domain-containing protein n=1 Tax=Ferrovibrio plantarum TaxID=3119164 RepID=UPI0031355665
MPGDGIVSPKYGVLAAGEQPEHPLLQRLLTDWRAAAAQNGLPSPAFVDPLKLNYLLGSLIIVGVMQDAEGDLRFNYRLVGTDLVARRGHDHTGGWMHEHEDPMVANTGPIVCRLAVETRQPVQMQAERRFEGRRYPVDYLLLPLAPSASGGIDRLLIAQLYGTDMPRLPYRGKAGL